MLFRFLPLGALLLLCSCSTDEVFEMNVELKTDLVSGEEFDVARVFVDGEARVTRQVQSGFGAAVIDGERVADLREEAGARRIRVELSFDGVSVLSREVLVDLDRDLPVTVVMTRDCLGIVCPDGSLSCLAGECVEEECVTGEEPSCPEAECENASDCPGGAACAVPSCAFGVCFLAGDSDRCEAANYCAPDEGCRTSSRIVESDAGMMDAGMDSGVDASMEAAADVSQDVAADVAPDVAPPECETGADCLDANECETATCPDGMCIYTADDSLCAGTDVCRAPGCAPLFDCEPRAGDRDGDGVADYRDPWPDDCNSNLLYDNFLAAPDSRFALLAGAMAEAGAVALPSGARLYTNAFPSELEVFVETEIEMGEILTPTQFSVGMFLHDGPAGHWTCHLYAHPATGDARPRLRHGSTHGGEPYAPAQFPYTAADLSVGQRYFLQGWVGDDGFYHCRLADEGSVLEETLSVPGASLPAEGGAVRVVVNSANARVLEFRALRH